MKYSKEEIEKMMATFDQFRRLFGGTKRGLSTEFEYFQKDHKDWADALPLLLPAVQRQLLVRERKSRSGEFVPYWKDLKTWIHNRCWEEEEGTDYKPAEDKPIVKAQDFFGTKPN